MKTERPKLKIALTQADKVIEVLCWSGLAALWIGAFLLYTRLSDIIPVHFNAAGKIDRIGPKSEIFFIPAITSVLVIGLGVLNRYPHTFNYLEEITPANAEQQYRLGTRLLRYSKFFVVALSGVVLMVAGKTGYQHLHAGESNWVVPVILVAVILLPVLLLLFMSRQTGK